MILEVKDMQKKIFIALLCLLLSACSTSPSLSDKQVADIVIEALVANDMKTVRSYFNNDMKEKLTEKLLSDTLDDIKTNIEGDGKIVNSYQENNSYYYVCDYDPQDLKFTITIDNGKVAGLFVTYTNETVTLENNDNYDQKQVSIGEYGLNGVLTIPSSCDNCKVVLMIQGSGVSDYNEAIGPNKPFEDIAIGLANNNIASLRYNKRFYQYQELAMDNDYDLSDEYLDDIDAAIELLSEEGFNDIYYLGHSQGGMFAHYEASKHDSIKGLILMASTSRSLMEVMIDQIADQLDAQGFSEEGKATYLSTYYDYLDQIDALDADSEETIMNIPAKYWYELKSTSYANNVIDIPCLVLQGSADFQVSVDKDFALWKELLGDKASYKLYDGLNHLMMPSIDGTMEEYNIKANVDERVIKDMADWISNN